MLLLRSLLFNFFLYTGIVVVFLIALPSLFLPPKITLLFGKFLGHYVVFIVKIFLNTKVEFKGIENIPLKKTNRMLRKKIQFVGPVCESSDKFLTQKKFSQIKEGDYVAIANAGAYGMSLSSNYNTRPTIAEIMINGSKHKIIRKRQSLENLVNN